MAFPWFVFALGVFPTLFAFVQNYRITPAREIAGPLLIGLGAAAVLLVLLFAVRRDWRAAGVATAILLGWFASFQLQWMVVQQLPVFPSKSMTIPLTGIPALFLAGVVLWRPKLAEPLMRPLNTFAFILLGITAVNLGIKVATTRTVDWTPSTHWPTESVDADAGPERDIYYIILDAYARADVLRDVYGYDNSAFLRALEEEGFHVIDNARANYTKTYLSLASSLNGQYLDELGRELGGTGGVDRRELPYEQMIHDNAVMAFLKRRGYTIYNFRTGWGPTKQLQAADVNVGCGLSTGWRFHKMLLSYTAAWTLRGRLLGRLNDHKTQSCLLEKLLRIHEEPGPKFVFAHFLTPHHPAIFGPDGEPAESDPSLLGDASAWANKAGYLGEVKYINTVMLRLVDTLRASGEPEPIIVLGSDHGSATAGWDDPLEVIPERVPILHTLYLPGVDSLPRDRLVTPVNTFRFIFSEYFGVPGELLPSHSYYSPQEDPKAFVHIDSLEVDAR